MPVKCRKITFNVSVKGVHLETRPLVQHPSREDALRQMSYPQYSLEETGECSKTPWMIYFNYLSVLFLE